MSALVSAMGAGFVFGIGLWISGMANPKKVLAFLDVTGYWDASLALVMAAAVAMPLVLFRVVLKREKPGLAEKFELPALKDIDLPLVAGAAIFGIGWGIGGYCPGPALTALSTLTTESIMFVVAMVVGGFAHKLITKA